MRIELASLEDGNGKFAHSYGPGELVLTDERLSLLRPPVTTGEIRREGRRVKVEGSVVARVQVECDRCLKLVELPVNSRFRVEYVSAEDYRAQQAVELSEDDLNLSVFDGEVIDIDMLVTEELMLAVPDHVLCDNACKGICPICGVNRNSADCSCETTEIDPRWAGLKELVNGNG